MTESRRTDLHSNALYELLPRHIRARDVEDGGGALLALLHVMDGERARLAADVSALADDLFIETCRDEMVPHLGALIAADPGASRAEVANTLAARRRPGVLATIEQLARDITGRPIRGMEYIPGMANRDLGIARHGAGDHVVVELSIADEVVVDRVFAHRVGPGLFTFDAGGDDTAICRDPTNESGAAGPDPIGPVDHAEDVFRHLTIWIDGQPLSPIAVDLADLADWARPRPWRIALDPDRGRLAFPADEDPAEVEVAFATSGGSPSDSIDEQHLLARLADAVPPGVEVRVRRVERLGDDRSAGPAGTDQ